jgi:hypothetical protein
MILARLVVPVVDRTGVWWQHRAYEAERLSSSTDLAKALFDEPTVVKRPKNAPPYSYWTRRLLTVLKRSTTIPYHVPNEFSRDPHLFLCYLLWQPKSTLRSSHRYLPSKFFDQNLLWNLSFLPRVYNLTLISQIYFKWLQHKHLEIST